MIKEIESQKCSVVNTDDDARSETDVSLSTPLVAVPAPFPALFLLHLP